VRKEAAPLVRAPGVEARLYSGVTGSTRSATRNRVPVTLLDLALAPGSRFQQDLPPSYNGFVYVIEGDGSVGEQAVAVGDVGWFAPAPATDLLITAGERGVRIVLYAGEPIAEPLIQHGPFVAGSRAEIDGLYQRFRAGQFSSMSELARNQNHQRQQEGRSV
jgi:quercetin 2,3-dioxygenase